MSIHHTKCNSVINRRDPDSKSVVRAARERTHQCGCSNWQSQGDGSFKVFRHGDWESPELGEAVEIQTKS